MGCLDAISSVLEYDTAKTVHIRSRKVGLLFRSLQLAILGYVIGYAIVYQKGYQSLDQAVSAITTKVKGTAAICRSNMTLDACPDAGIEIWDTADYVIPAQESNALFVVTNSLLTPQQYQRPEGWDEDPGAKITGSQRVYNCTSDDDCPRLANSRNGLLTGVCNTTIERCRVFGWGPVELSKLDDETQQPGFHRQMPQALNFTVFIKNNIFFPRFDVKFNNTGDSQEYLSTCIWDPDTDPYCPIFRIGDIISQSAPPSQINIDNILAGGAVITVRIRYDCNLDVSKTRCRPKVRMTRIDQPENKITKGFNFRYAKYNIANDTNPVRDLYKLYGLRFVFIASGQAGMFNFVPLFVALGSGLGLLGIATVVADILVTKVINHRKYYSAKKYEIVDEEDIEHEMLEDISSIRTTTSKGRDVETQPLISHSDA